MVDDIAGLAIGAIAVLLAGVATGHLRLAVPVRWRPVIPNALTVARIAMVPLIVWLLIEDGGESMIAAVLFAIASLSDACDGFLARRWKVQSVFGALTDPFADKLLVLASLGALAAVGRVPWWIFALIGAARAVGDHPARPREAPRRRDRRRARWARLKMAVQVCALLALMAFDITGVVARAAALRDGRDHDRLGHRGRAARAARAPRRSPPRRPSRPGVGHCGAGRRPDAENRAPARIISRSRAARPPPDPEPRLPTNGCDREPQYAAVSPSVWPAVAASVAEARTAVTAFAESAGATADALAAVSLAVSEAVTNAVLHAYLDRETPGTVEVRARVRGRAGRRRRWPTRAAGCCRAPTAPASASGCR